MTKSIGNYQVIRQLGEGHYGTVYLAVGEVPARGPKPPRRRIVAIKTLREDADEEAMALLTQEFALLEQVKHRGIVRVFEYLYDENAVVMEYIHGVSLQDLLDALNHKNEQIFTEAVIEIGIEVADALYQAFTTPGDNGNPLQLVHRDLKPANIMLTPQGEVKVLDLAWLGWTTQISLVTTQTASEALPSTWRPSRPAVRRLDTPQTSSRWA